MINRPRVTIIILNWNSYEVSRDCLHSLQEIDYKNREILLVDNGSEDGSGDQLAKEFPDVRLLSNLVNLGFAAGCNVAITEALNRGTDYILLLNNDTVVASDFLTKIVQVAETSPIVGIVSPKIYYLRPADRIWYAGGIYKPWWSFPRVLGHRQQDRGQYNYHAEVSFVSGCAMLIKANVIKQIGFLDETFVHSFEDLDWSTRAIAAGFKAIYVPESIVWHNESYVTKKNFGKQFRDFYSMRNSVLFARKHRLGKYWPAFLVSYMRWTIYRTAGYLIRWEPARVQAIYKGIWSGLMTRMPRKPNQSL